MRLATLTVAVALLALLAAPVSAALLDDFSGDLSNYTNYVILDANGGASNTAAWQITAGVLELDTTAYDGIEQSVLLYNGVNLAVGQELQMDVTRNTASRDLGLYVGKAPVAGVRESYVNVYSQYSTVISSRGFNGTSEMNLKGATGITYDKLFIKRDAVNDYEAGYYDGATRVVVADRNNLVSDVGQGYIGIYSDVRAVGTLGIGDNLMIIPEPAAASLFGLGLFGFLAARRRTA